VIYELRFTIYEFTLSTFNIIMKHTQTATVREMRTLVNTCQKHAADAAESWKNCHTLAATAHSAANRAGLDAIAAEKAVAHAKKLLRSNVIIMVILTVINLTAFILVLI
jgi:hypothetical protein